MIKKIAWTFVLCLLASACSTASPAQHSNLYCPDGQDVLRLARQYGFRDSALGMGQVRANASGSQVIVVDNQNGNRDLYVFSKSEQLPRVVHQPKDAAVALDDEANILAVSERGNWRLPNGVSLNTSELLYDSQRKLFLERGTPWHLRSFVDLSQASPLEVPEGSRPYIMSIRGERLHLFCNGNPTMCYLYSWQADRFQRTGEIKLPGWVLSADSRSDDVVISSEILPVLWYVRLFNLADRRETPLNSFRCIPLFLEDDWFVERLKSDRAMRK